MNQFLFSRLFSFLISVGLLFSPLPMKAIVEEIALSQQESDMVVNNPHDSYVYLGNELSDITPIIEKIACLDNDHNSLVHALKKHIDNGFFLARYDAVIQALQHAALVLERNCTKADNAENNRLMNDFELLINQITNGALHVNSQALQNIHNGSGSDNLETLRAPNLPLLIVDKNVVVLGKTTLRTHLNTKQGIHCQGHLNVNKSATFKKGVKIKGFLSAGDAFIGNLSVGDLAIASCIDNLCVNNLSVNDLAVANCMNSLCVNNLSAVDVSISGTLSANDAFIDNATINNLTIVASVLDSVINNLTVNATASINDAIITNATITNLSSTDANIQNLTVANCMTNLCVNSLSVVDMSISGTLSINDIIIDDATILDFSAVDASITGSLEITPFTTAGVVHNDASGLLSTSLIVNADVDPAAAIVDTKLATINTAGKVDNTATTATSTNTANAIVARDASGDFTAGIITASLNGNATTATTATNFSGSLAGDVTGTQGATVVSLVGGQTAANVAAGSVLANAATDLNTASTIVRRDASGDFSAGTITANLSGNATTATDFSGSLAGDVTGTQGATVVSLVGGQTAANIAAGSVLANSGTSANTPNTLVLRGASGEFSAGAVNVTDSIISNTATITPFTTAGVVHNDASGLLSSSLIVDADITNATISNAKLATISSSNTPGGIVVRDGSGNFITNEITIQGTVTNPTDAATKAYVDAAVTSGLVAKDPAVVVSIANEALSGLPTIDGVLLVAGDRVLLTGQTDPIENGLWEAAVGAWTRPADFASGDLVGQAYVLILSGTVYAGSSWLSNTPTAVIDTDPIGFALFSLPNTTTGANVGAGTGLIFRDKTGNTINFKTLIAGTDIVITNNANDITVATNGTSANTANTLVERNASGNFSAGTITATLSGNATTATTATNFSGSLAGNVTGTQGATVVAIVGGQTAANVAAATLLANAATSANTASTIVRRDASGNFTATDINMNDAFLSGNIAFSAATSTSTTGNITKAGNRFIHNFGTNNTFVGINSGNFTLTGNQNVGVGNTSLSALTTGTSNAALGFLALNADTTGINNVAVGAGSLQLNVTGQNNVGVGFQALLNNTIDGTTAVGFQALRLNTTGSGNTAVGNTALSANTIGSFNVAVGDNALSSNTTGTQNTAVGYLAMENNTTGGANTACGVLSLQLNTIGAANTAIGQNSLSNNTTGSGNVAMGAHALENNTTGQLNVGAGFNSLSALTTGSQNVAYGTNSFEALTTGSGNTGLGAFAGQNSTGASSNNIYINNLGAVENNTIRIGSGTQTRCFISGVRGVTTGSATGINVLIDVNGQLGTISSSRRYKHDIQDMNDISSQILNLRPVTFAYNSDKSETQQFGLIAEEVQEVLPEIVVNNEDGQPETVQYHVLPVLLLNEIKKQQALINSQQEAMEEQENAIEALVITVTAMNNAINELQSQMKSFMNRSHSA